MKRVVNPCVCEVYNGGKVRAYAEIEYKNGNLSIHGVIGPMSNGNCKGSAGQCVDEIRAGEPTDGWNEEMLRKFCDIWKRWHLNDMLPCCEHQRKLGWMEQAEEKVKIEKWTLTRESLKAKRAAKKRAVEALRDGNPFHPTKDEVVYANMPYEIKSYNGEGISYHGTTYRDAYELKEKDCLGHSNTEYKTRGWISYDEHPLGFIRRPCPVCGYKYGTAWKREEVPEEIINWLFNLPEAKIKPVWV